MSDVNVSIGVSLRELQQGLGQAGTLVKDFKKEAQHASHAAHFLGSAIENIAGSSGMAGKAATNLLSGLMMGGPMGLAIGGVNALIGAFKDLREEEKTATEEAKKQALERKAAYEAASDGLYKEQTALAKRKFIAAGGTAEGFDVLQTPNEDVEVQRAQLTVNNAKEALRVKLAYLRTQVLSREEVVKQSKAEQDVLRDANASLKVAEDRYKTAIKTAGVAEQEAARKKTEADQRTAYEKAKALHDQELADALARTDYEYDQVDQAQRAKEEAFKKAAEENRKRLKDELTATDLAYDEADERAKKSLDALQVKAQMFEIAISPIAMGFQSLFDAIIQGGRNMGQVMSGIAKNILSSYISMLIQIGVKKIAVSLAETAADAATTGIEKAKNISGISGAAGLAGAEAAAAVAGIPVVGPAMAIAAMESVSSSVLASMMPLAAASRGFDVGNYNPITQLHAREMVLPAELADNVRNMTGNGNGNTYVINALDSKSFYAALKANDGALIKVLDNAAAEGRF